MRRALARFSGPVSSIRAPSLAGSITTTPEFRISVHTARPKANRPFAQNAGTADAEIRLVAGDRFGDADTRPALANGDVETGVAVEILFKRRVVAGELKLVLPF